MDIAGSDVGRFFFWNRNESLDGGFLCKVRAATACTEIGEVCTSL